LDDQKIIGLFFERSPQALKEVEKKYGKLFKKLSNNILNNSLDAEECVNDAYLGAWNSIPPARPEPLLAYLCKIVRNISLRRYYKNKKAARNSVFEVSLDEIENLFSDGNTPEKELETKELSRRIEAFLETLEKQDRVIFMRRYAFCDSYKDIAEAIGHPKAFRAVGMANHANPIFIAIPCHRVIGASGSLVGYGGGLEMKKALLELERSNRE